jgi:competence protein ComFC
MLMRLFSKFLDLLFPPKCAFCHALLKPGEEDGVCGKCEKSLPYTSGSDIKQKMPFISECCAPLYYEGSVRQSLLRYKFGQCTGYAEIYGGLVSECICENLGGQFDVVSWVPLSRARKKKRGYDQAYLIAASVGRRLDMPVVPTLKKVKNVKAQSSTGSAEKRRANISGAYAVIDVQSVSGKRILLVDDIITTGSTLSECARTLQMAGAGTITAAAVARHRD